MIDASVAEEYNHSWEVIPVQAHPPTLIEAVYRDGVIQPSTPLSLPDETRIRLMILTSETEPEGKKRTSLFGAFPELAAVDDNDIAWAKKRWDEGINRQAKG